MQKFAVILDLNGTLADTEIAHASAYQKVLSPYGISLTIQDFTHYWSTHGKKLVGFLEAIGRNDLLPQARELHEEKNRIFRDMLANTAVLMPGVKEFVVELQRLDIPLGLETSSPMENVNKLLSHFSLEGVFDAIVASDTEIDEQKYGSNKEKPARLLALAELLGYLPAKCVMIGDAEKDIVGAKEAGMNAIAVPNQYTRDNNFTRADRKVRSLQEITSELLSSFFA